MKLNELKPLFLDSIVLVHEDLQRFQVLEEGKLVSGRFPRNIRLDQATHLQGDGQLHAHIFGRKGNELGVVNLDGSASHSSKFKLHDKDADTLRGLGFVIPADNLVEWTLWSQEDARELLLG
jgi:hypothetical protein